MVPGSVDAPNLRRRREQVEAEGRYRGSTPGLIKLGGDNRLVRFDDKHLGRW